MLMKYFEIRLSGFNSHLCHLLAINVGRHAGFVVPVNLSVKQISKIWDIEEQKYR